MIMIYYLILLIFQVVGLSVEYGIHPKLSTPKGYSVERKEQNTEFWLNKGQDILREKLMKLSQGNKNKAKNIIMFLGDGMSLHTVAATRAFAGDSNYQMSFDKFPYVGLARTYAVDKRTPDSANTATAYLSGVKGNFGTIGVDARVKLSDCYAAADASTHTESIAKWAQDADKWTGLVTTARVTHASPAGVYAHTADRNWESDTVIELMGCSSKLNVDIARQLVEWPVGRKLRLIMGGGRENFRDQSLYDEEGFPHMRNDQRDLIREWMQQKLNDNYNAEYVWNKPQLEMLDLNETDFLLGLFSSSHCPYHGDLKRHQLNDVVPSLSEMTETAIKFLNRSSEGYFLFVEGARIDMAHHYSLAHKALEDTLEFAKAIELARNLTSEEDTLIVVTSDHSHTMTINGYPYRKQNIFDVVPDMADDGKPYTILSYANGLGYENAFPRGSGRTDFSKVNTDDPEFLFMATVPLQWETHGAEDVGVYASGPYEHLFTGNYEQSNIPIAMAYAANIGPYSHSNLT